MFISAITFRRRYRVYRTPTPNEAQWEFAFGENPRETVSLRPENNLGTSFTGRFSPLAPTTRRSCLVPKTRHENMHLRKSILFHLPNKSKRRFHTTSVQRTEIRRRYCICALCFSSTCIWRKVLTIIEIRPTVDEHLSKSVSYRSCYTLTFTETHFESSSILSLRSRTWIINRYP